MKKRDEPRVETRHVGVSFIPAQENFVTGMLALAELLNVSPYMEILFVESGPEGQPGWILVTGPRRPENEKLYLEALVKLTKERH